jgi:tetratricopeptide (TPR) repeat protein
MDGRKPLALALGLLAGVAGCQHPAGGARVETTKAMKPAEPAAPPKASTYVALGDFRAKSGFAPEVPAAQQKQYREEARLSYQKALELDRKYLPAHLALARLYAAMGDHGSAAAAYHNALQIDNKPAALWFELGMCQSRRKEWGPAVDALKRATERDPDNRQYANTLGFTLACAGRYPESLDCFARVSTPAQAHYNLARMLRHLNRPELAREHARLALGKDPHLAPAQALLAELDGPAGRSPIETVGYCEEVPAPPAPGGPAGAPIPLPPLPILEHGALRDDPKNSGAAAPK